VEQVGFMIAAMMLRRSWCEALRAVDSTHQKFYFEFFRVAGWVNSRKIRLIVLYIAKHRADDGN